jgi:hypothetical protein
LVNTPAAFHKAFKMFVEPRMSPATLQKMKVLPSDKQTIIDEMTKNGIPVSAIPVWLGGQHAGRQMLDITKALIAESAAAAAGASAAKADTK